MKRQLLTIILLGLLLSSGLTIFLNPELREVQGSLAGWDWRKGFTIGASAGAGSAYVIKIVVHVGSGSDSGSNVYVPVGHCRTDFGDLRFTLYDTVTLVPYVIVAYTANVSADVWVKIPVSLASGATLWMQYGNSGATTTGNGEAVFTVYDDFNDASFNSTKWDYGESYGTGFYDESGGILTLVMAQAGQFNYIKSKAAYSGGIAVEGSASLYSSGSNGAVKMGLATYASAQPWATTFIDFISGFGGITGKSHSCWFVSNASGNSGFQEYLVSSGTTFYDFAAYRQDGVHESRVQCNGESVTSAIYTTNNLYVTFCSLYTEYGKLNWIALRPYVSPEPSITTWSAELDNNYAFEITNREFPNFSGKYYVFAKEKYYNFQAMFHNLTALSDAYLYFVDWNIPVGLGYDFATGQGSIIYGDSIITLGTAYETEVDATHINVTWPLYFNEKCMDAYNVDVYLAATFADLSTYGPANTAPAYFNIYNLGGENTQTHSGNSGRIGGGDTFDLYSYGNEAYSSVEYRNLIHVKLLPEIDCEISGAQWQISYGLDYLVADSSDWITGAQISIEASAVCVGLSRWINFTVSLYNNDVLVNQTETFAYHGPGNGANERTKTKLWIDLWFNRENASSVIGGRVNAFYYPMTDASSVWLRWLSGSEWGANETQTKEIMLFDTLRNSTGGLLYAPEIRMIRLWSWLQVDPLEGHDYVTASNYEVFDLTFAAQYPIQGIQTPQFDNTQIPKMDSGGLLGAIWTALSNFGKTLADFFGPVILSWAATLVAWLDTASGFFGYPHFFSDLFAFMANLWSAFVASLVYVGGAIGNMLLFATSWLAWFFQLLSQGLVQFTSMIGMVVGFVTGGYGTIANVWTAYGISTWITIAIIFYPMYLIWLWSEKGTDALVSHITMIVGIGSWIFGALIWVAQTFIETLSRIIEAIPLAE